MCKIWGLSLVFGLGFGVTSASARGDDAEKKASPPAHVKKEGITVGVTFSETHDVALTADGKTLARAGYGRLDLWDVASGKKLHTLKGHTAPLLRVKFSPDGKTLASITGGWGPDNVPGEVKLWDVATGKERVALKGHPTRGLALAFSPDGKTLASSAGAVKLWDVTTGKERARTLPAHANSITCVRFASDGKTLASVSGTVSLAPKPGVIK